MKKSQEFHKSLEDNLKQLQADSKKELQDLKDQIAKRKKEAEEARSKARGLKVAAWCTCWIPLVGAGLAIGSAVEGGKARGHDSAVSDMQKNHAKYSAAFEDAIAELKDLYEKSNKEVDALTRFTKIVTSMKEILEECKTLSENFKFAEILPKLTQFEAKLKELYKVNEELNYESVKTKR